MIFFNDRTEGGYTERFSSLLQKVVTATVDKLYKNPNDFWEISISFVTRAEIRRLNREYRNVDSETDVLSFHTTDPHILGDIVICADKITEQAQDYFHSEEREVAFLAVHGTLHLLGFDHFDEQSEKEMFQHQKKILESIGLGRD